VECKFWGPEAPGTDAKSQSAKEKEEKGAFERAVKTGLNVIMLLAFPFPGESRGQKTD
jgi:hypothetical protein